ncbi:MAG TPA: PAS domain S-box protein [Candidatus Limnocylindrales bacterium]|nr:PAS domain S-box protein [Candidatus Limnocylindrales bacterium]
MMTPSAKEGKWDERASSPRWLIEQTGPVFDSLFERSADAIWLFDPQAGVFVDCNAAAVELMRAGTKEKLLGARPEDLSPPLQADGTPTHEKSAQILALVEKHGSYRFEWLGRRFDGQDVPLEVLVTQIRAGDRNLNVTVSRDLTERKRTEAALRESEEKFRELFEASTDAIAILDPDTGMNIACNEATVKMAGGGDKDWFLSQPAGSLSPERQPDGRSSAEAAQAWIGRALSHGPQRFEWVGRRFTGEEFPVEVLLTPVRLSGRVLLVTVSRDISERKKTERELRELNQSLERRVAERTAALTTSEARFRALVEHAPEAIVVFEGDTGRFLFGNEHACALYGVPKERLTELTPADVSPEFQPEGGRSSELAREIMDEALAGGTPVFEWIHQQPDGRLIPTEVRLLRLPAEGQNLVRASIIDNTERKRAEQALRESEEKFRALFEGSSHGVVLHDENQILEVNPAAVRIMGCQRPQELLGKHPSETSPPFQPNGESSAVLGRKYIQECMTDGSARFEWMSRNPQGGEVPLEVALTRIQWSGRQVIQALITDITERKQAEHALREANRELRREIEQRTRAEESLKERVRTSKLSTEIALALNAGTEMQAMLQQCVELVVRHLDVAFSRIWTLNETTQTLELQASAGCYTHLDGPHSRVRVGQYKIGLIAQEKKPHLTNSVQADDRVSDKDWATREGMVAFAGYPLLLEDRVLGVLALFARRSLAHDVLKALGSVADSVALGIERKRGQTALAESEMRFSAAFHSSPIITGITRASDGKFVLVNDASLDWSGYGRDEILGRTAIELGFWENAAERERFWGDARSSGSIRARECRLRNRHGRFSTMLGSGAIIVLNGEDHLLFMMLDISQRKQAEAEVHRALAREMELSQLKSNFVSMVSHEFRTPLGIIQSSAELLRDFYQKMLPADRDEQLESITRNTRRMAEMMEEILILSRLDAGKLDFQPAVLDLKAFCRRLVDEVLSATSRRCPIELSLASALPQAHADQRLLAHILTNLLSNAVKYSEPGVCVRFAVERDSTEALFVIRDEGIGIFEEDKQRLFTAFHRGANVGIRAGTGLGLVLVKRCVEMHRGKVRIESKVGQGTTVTVRVPVFKINL